ncbi:MAG: hypothetical protein ACQCN6_10455 [Candidatus Bathyarchaeia archaeon]|jgi:hypothetical protein
MPKTLHLPQSVYDNLVKTSEELTLMAKKPISPAMTVDLLMEIYRAHLNNPCVLDAFSLQLRNSDFMSPEEFDKYWDDTLPKPNHKAKHKKANGR